MTIFEQIESNVRSYSRDFPATFERASGYRIFDTEGRAYIDFLAGAGALNYGHNDPDMKRRLIEYLENDGITHSLDKQTTAKAAFLEAFKSVILDPRGLDYKVMFPGPTGTNSVESALKLARKVTGRASVIGFTAGFHGMTLGSLAVTANAFKRAGAGVPLENGVAMPYDGYLGDGVDTTETLDRLLSDGGSGVDLPAAVIVETVQGEGGVNVARDDWLRRLEAVCRKHEILLIVDDVQAGCGRTGPFFSFEPAGIRPDIVCLSKSIGGYGLPMALTLFRSDLDIWAPGEHNGTFRGNNAAFVTATAALEHWKTADLAEATRRKGEIAREHLEAMVRDFPSACAHARGCGLMQGLVCGIDGLAGKVAQEAFTRGLIIETSGPDSEVLKVMPPLIIDEEGLETGLGILRASLEAVLARDAGENRQAA